MRHRPLHAALSAFAEEAATQLAEATADGAEVPFEIIESRGARRDTPLYCYRPLTESFIRDRVGVLERLPSYPVAARALAALDGVGDYLREQSEPRVPVEARERADVALRVFVSRVFSEATEFIITPERFERAYDELEDALLEGRAECVVVAPLLGLQLVSAEVPMGQGLSLIRGDALPDAPPEALWSGSSEEPAVLACLTLTNDPGAPTPLSEASVRFRRLLTALRLYDPVRVALGPIAWERTAAGPWSIGGLGTAGRANGTLLIEEAAEDELRAFCNLTARRTPRSGEVAWALRRFELGCERSNAFEALTDHLLALRALLEPEGPQSGRLAGRVAALCAIARAAPAGHPAGRSCRRFRTLDHLGPRARRRRCREAARRDDEPPARTPARRALRPPGGRSARGRRPAARRSTAPPRDDCSGAGRSGPGGHERERHPGELLGERPQSLRASRRRAPRRCAWRAPGGRAAPEVRPGRCSSRRGTSCVAAKSVGSAPDLVALCDQAVRDGHDPVLQPAAGVPLQARARHSPDGRRRRRTGEPASSRRRCSSSVKRRLASFDWPYAVQRP